MVPRPKEVKPLENYNLQIIFDNGEKKIYDMSNSEEIYNNSKKIQ